MAHKAFLIETGNREEFGSLVSSALDDLQALEMEIVFMDYNAVPITLGNGSLQGDIPNTHSLGKGQFSGTTNTFTNPSYTALIVGRD